MKNRLKYGEKQEKKKRKGGRKWRFKGEKERTQRRID